MILIRYQLKYHYACFRKSLLCELKSTKDVLISSLRNVQDLEIESKKVPQLELRIDELERSLLSKKYVFTFELLVTNYPLFIVLGNNQNFPLKGLMIALFLPHLKVNKMTAAQNCLINQSQVNKIFCETLSSFSASFFRR